MSTQVAAEIILMARCGYVIGTLSSNIGRLVHELQGNRHRFHDLDGLPAWFLAGDGVVENNVRGCVQINQCVGCTRQFFTKSFLGDDAAVLALSSSEEPASPGHRAGVASMACRSTRRFSTNAP